ncbi:MAG: hypothetical protein WDO68_18800 [Gammaproteobacteria bacterium]
MNPLFWSVVCLDAALFLGLLVSMLLQRDGSSNGGREMGIAFFVIAPLILIGVAVLLYVFSRSLTWKIVALIIVAGPGLFIAGGRIRNAYIDYVVRQNALGRGYFSSTALKEMGAAVVQADLATLQRLGPTVDVNTVGERGMTLIAMAVDQAFNAPDEEHAGRRRTVIETLIRLGAKPGPAMSAALKLKDPMVFNALLEAGADANALTEQGSPLVFEGLSVMPVENLRLLIGHGLNVNVIRYNTPLAVEITLQRRWDLLLLLARSGADLRKPRDDGRNVADELTIRVEEAKSEGHEPPADLLRVRELLGAR